MTRGIKLLNDKIAINVLAKELENVIEVTKAVEGRSFVKAI